MSSQQIHKLAFSTDDALREIARIGLVVLASDYTVEHEFRLVFNALLQHREQQPHLSGQVNAVLSPPVDFFTARIANSPQVTAATLADMQSRITATAELILAGDTLDVVAYCCTSASVVMGEQAVFERLLAAQPNAKFTTPVTAAMASLHALDASRIAVLTPYRNEINQQIASYLSDRGFDVACFGSFNEEMDPVVACIDASSIETGIQQLIDSLHGVDRVDAVFVSCTSIRLLHALAAIESRLGVPVITSNQALIWHCLRLAGCDQSVPGFGSLLSLSTDV